MMLSMPCLRLLAIDRWLNRLSMFKFFHSVFMNVANYFSTLVTVERQFRNYLGWKIYFIIILIFLSALAESIGVVVIIPLIEQVVNSQNNKSSVSEISTFASSLNHLPVGDLVLIILALYVLKSIFLFIAYSTNSYFRSKIHRILKEKLIEKIFQNGVDVFSKRPAGRGANIIGEQASRSVQAFFYFVQFGAQLISMCVYGLVAVFIVDDSIYMSLAFGVIVLALFKLINNKIASWSKITAERNEDLTGVVVEGERAFEYLSITGMASTWAGKAVKEVEVLTRLQFFSGILAGVTQAGREPLALSMIIVYLYFQDLSIASLGAAAASLVLLYRALNCVVGAQQQWQNMLEWIGSFRMVDAELSNVIQIETVVDNKPLIDIPRIEALEFGGVEIIHTQNSEAILSGKPISDFRITFRDAVALVGESGSGKTSILRLLACLNQHSAGRITINGIDSSSIDLVSWRSCIGYLPQDPVFFDGGLIENLMFGVSNSRESCIDQIRSLLKVLGMADLCSALKDGNDLVVGSKGRRLSGGERQRLALIREIIKRPRILFLDEPTSALDEDSSSSVKMLLQSILREGVQIVFISHSRDFCEIAQMVLRVRNDKNEIVLEVESEKI